MAVHVGGKGVGHQARVGGFLPDASVALAFNEGRYRVGLGSGSTSDFASLPGLTVTRSSGKYAETSSGTLQWFAANVAAITDKGLLVEEARTNVCLHSNAPGGGGWENFATNTVTGVTAPDGTSTAIRFTPGVVRTTITPATAGQTYTLSAYVRAASTGGANAVWLMTNNTAANSTGIEQKFTLTTAWQRVVMTGVAIASGSLMYFHIGTKRADGSTDATITGNIEVWGAQVEVGSFATSYIPTTGASATRAADQVRITGQGGLLGGPLTVVVDVDLGVTADGLTRRIFALGDGTANNRVQLARAVANSLQASWTVGGAASFGSAIGSFTGPARFKGALRHDGTHYRMVAAGVLASLNVGTFPTGLNQIDLGEWLASPGSPLNGYLRAFVIYPVLTDADMQARAA